MLIDVCHTCVFSPASRFMVQMNEPLPFVPSYLARNVPDQFGEDFFESSIKHAVYPNLQVAVAENKHSSSCKNINNYISVKADFRFVLSPFIENNLSSMSKGGTPSSFFPAFPINPPVSGSYPILYHHSRANNYHRRHYTEMQT